MRIPAAAADRTWGLWPVCRKHLALVTLLGVMLALPESSLAGTASVVPGFDDGYSEPTPPFATYEAHPGERNRVSVVLSADRYSIRDTGSGVLAGKGCIQVSPHEVSCPAAGDEEIVVNGGDEGDTIRVEATGALARVFGGGGNDILRLLNDTNGTVSGDSGDDVLRGDGASADSTGEDDDLWGGSGNDRISGGNGNDHLEGDEGDDRLSGGVGADRHFGGIGNDIVDGGPGQDELEGGRRRTSEGTLVSDDDRLTGGSGPDLLTGGAGGDQLTGGGGVDAVDYEGADLVGQRSGPNLTIRLDAEPNDGVDGEGDSVEPDVERAIWRARRTFATRLSGEWLLDGPFRRVGAEILLLSGSGAADSATSGTFLGGPFSLRTGSSGKAGADVALSGDQLRRCPRASPRRPQSSPARRLTRYLRTLVQQDRRMSTARASLQTGAKRSFRVEGRFSSATALGDAEWSTMDTCRGTLTTVQDGTVLVEDRRGRKRRLGAGDRYLAKPRRSSPARRRSGRGAAIAP